MNVQICIIFNSKTNKILDLSQGAQMFADNCKCHSEKKQQPGLSFRSEDSLLFLRFHFAPISIHSLIPLLHLSNLYLIFYLLLSLTFHLVQVFPSPTYLSLLPNFLSDMLTLAHIKCYIFNLYVCVCVCFLINVCHLMSVCVRYKHPYVFMCHCQLLKLNTISHHASEVTSHKEEQTLKKHMEITLHMVMVNVNYIPI